MKLSALLIGVCISATTFAQNTTKSTVTNNPESPAKSELADIPKAQLNKVTQGANFTYNFVSNRPMNVERASRWEGRLVTMYQDLVSISIDPNTQQVELIMLASHSSEDLEELVARFGYSGYQLVI